jgi:hypothetical protein
MPRAASLIPAAARGFAGITDKRVFVISPMSGSLAPVAVRAKAPHPSAGTPGVLVPVAAGNPIRAAADVVMGYPRAGMIDLLKSSAHGSWDCSDRMRPAKLNWRFSSSIFDT